MAAIGRCVPLNDGSSIPNLGLGTCSLDKDIDGGRFGDDNAIECQGNVVGLSEMLVKGDTAKAVKTGIEIGYRHLDGALMYGNEDEIGEAIRAKIADGTVKREDIFYTSKVWMTYLSPDLVRNALTKTLKSLRLDYVDLYLIHWPMALKASEKELFPRDASGKILHENVDLRETWAVMEGCKDDGLVRSIGVSNFNRRQLEMILQMPNLKYKPVCNQVECHPYLNQSKLLMYCKSNNIVLVGYSPLGRPQDPALVNTKNPILLNDPELKKMGEKHQKTAAQIALRYQVQRGVVVIPKSFSPGRMKQNKEIFDFCLTDEDMKRIDGINKNCRYVTEETLIDHPNYPFHDEY